MKMTVEVTQYYDPDLRDFQKVIIFDEECFEIKPIYLKHRLDNPCKSNGCDFWYSASELPIIKFDDELLNEIGEFLGFRMSGDDLRNAIELGYVYVSDRRIR